MAQVSEHQQLIDVLGMILVEQQRTSEVITQLAEAIAGIKRSEPTTDSPKQDPEPEQKDIDLSDTPEAKWAEPNCTKDQLQSYCLSRVREDKTFKSKLTEVLSKYGVKTISKLADGDAPKVYAELEGVDYN
jgi:hypothetical protein